MISSSQIFAVAYAEVKKERDCGRAMQFLMKLIPEFETTRGALINRGNLTMESVLGELIRDETRLKT